MKLKLDENLSRHLKQSLEPLGHDVTTAAEEGRYCFVQAGEFRPIGRQSID